MSNLSRDSNVVGRREFIKRFIDQCDITYDTANAIYEAMVSTFEEGIANGHKVGIGKLGALVPTWQDSRTVEMGFRRVPGGVVRHKQEYFLDPRLRYKFKIYKKWMTKSRLNWRR
jgi:hypothetical protein